MSAADLDLEKEDIEMTGEVKEDIGLDLMSAEDAVALVIDRESTVVIEREGEMTLAPKKNIEAIDTALEGTMKGVMVEEQGPLLLNLTNLDLGDRLVKKGGQ